MHSAAQAFSRAKAIGAAKCLCRAIHGGTVVAHGAAVPRRFSASTVPHAWNCATRHGHAPIHLLRPLPRPVPPMNFTPATTPSLHGIELYAGVELRVDEPFATRCFRHFRCMFHVFSLSTAAHINHRNDWSSFPPYTPLTLIIGESIDHKHSWTRGVAPKQLIGYIYVRPHRGSSSDAFDFWPPPPYLSFQLHRIDRNATIKLRSWIPSG